jgi:lysophospholipase L1-like esterase
MSVLYTSNFDAATLGSIAPGWVNVAGTWQVTTTGAVSGSQAFKSSGNADGDVAMYTGVTASADMQVDFSQVIVTSAGKFPLIGSILRGDASGQNHYLMLMGNSTTTGCTVALYTKNGGTYTLITSTPITYGVTLSAGQVYKVRAKIVGSSLSFYIGIGTLPGTPSASFTNTSITAAGYSGLYNALDTTTAIMAVDDYTLDDTSVPVANNPLTSGTANVLWSPYNWNVGTSAAKTINPGAYFKTIFTGTACSLQFDMTGVLTPLPQISYRIDGTGAWITAPIAASVVLTLPSGSNSTSDYATKGGHLLEVVVKSMTETQARWSTQATAVNLTGIILDTSATLTKPTALPLNALFYGDSITEGVRTLNGTATNDTDRNDAAQGWAYHAARILGAEVGIVGFGASGFTVTGSGGVPVLSTSYNLLYSGVSRSFSVAPDFIVLMEGTNDGATDVTTAATTVLNSLLAATPASTKIVVLRPFNGTSQAARLQAAIAACSTPSRCTYVDTASWFNTTNSYDALHPYGIENLTHIAPLAANAIRPLLQITRGARTARTVTLTLKDRTGTPRANLTGLKWAFFDQTTAAALIVNADSGASATTDANGTLTLTVQTTLPSGGTGWLVLSDSAGSSAVASNAFSAPVTVA